jgi:predicted nucleic acid-binding Zn ribbon protein
VQKFSDPPLSVCDACGGKLRKVFSPVGIVFKGSGFYRTDSRKAASASDTAKDAKPGAGDSSSSAAKPDSASGSSSAGDSKPSTLAPAKPASSGEKVA